MDELRRIVIDQQQALLSAMRSSQMAADAASATATALMATMSGVARVEPSGLAASTNVTLTQNPGRIVQKHIMTWMMT